MLNQKFTGLLRKLFTMTIACLTAAVFAPLTSSAQPPAPKPCFDFTGTGRTSFATVTGSQIDGANIGWHILSNGGDGSVQNYFFGLGGIETRDGIIPGYYDDDNRADAAVTRFSGFQSGNITYYVRPTTLTAANPGAFYAVQWGAFFDLPKTGDYDGDGRTDFTAVRRNSAVLVWYILRSDTNTFSAVNFGLSSDMVTNGADYNGDGRDEITVIRTYPAAENRASTYFAGDSTTGALVLAQDWGSTSDIYVTGDYLGDRRADFAVMRKKNSGVPAQNATWYILENGGSHQIVTRVFGYGDAETSTSDLALCGDYNGDGKQDIAIYRYTDRNFYWLNSPEFNSFAGQNWGTPNNLNIPIGNLYTNSR